MSSSTPNLADREYVLNVGRCFDRGWDIFQKNTWGFIGFILLFGLSNILFSLTSEILAEEDTSISYGVRQLLFFYQILIAPVIYAGLWIVPLEIARNRTVRFGDFFSGFYRYWSILLVTNITYLSISAGLIFLLIPGIALFTLYKFSLPLVIDRNLNFWLAMETSRQIIMKNFFSFLMLDILVVFLNLAGLLMMGVGILFTLSWSICVQIAAYESVVGLSPSRR
ncbi:MAG: hypothetical protein F6J95_013125 [Leptolyngbya sp. SIO1E4]|nr:hypothetical protein [Leptolyngbya sp. SIO1E4]